MPNSETPTQRSVFISYSRNNRDAALEIRKLLDVKVWLDVVDIRTSKELLQELFDNIDIQNLFCLLLSPTSVASEWVQEEIRHAIAKPGLQVLPIILQSCRIPDDLKNIVALDARQGLDQESVRSRLLRAVCGTDKVPDGILLNHIEREILAKKEIQEAADKELPKISQSLDSISRGPIRKIEFSFDFQSIPNDPNTILELQVGLDIWTSSLSPIVARYREGETWPSFRKESCSGARFPGRNEPNISTDHPGPLHSGILHRAVNEKRQGRATKRAPGRYGCDRD
jgi:TIR domain